MFEKITTRRVQRRRLSAYLDDGRLYRQPWTACSHVRAHEPPFGSLSSVVPTCALAPIPFKNSWGKAEQTWQSRHGYIPNPCSFYGLYHDWAIALVTSQQPP